MPIEYARYTGNRRRLVCPCGEAHWKPAIMNEGIGGRALWSIDPKDEDYYNCDGFGCLECGRVIERKENHFGFTVIATARLTKES